MALNDIIKLPEPTKFYKVDPIDETEKGIAEVEEWKRLKRKGEVIFLLDGSGRVAKVKISSFI